MSIWSCVYELKVWDEDYQPKDRNSEVWIHVAPSWNDCIRLDAGGMLDRDMARELAAKLQEFADHGSGAVQRRYWRDEEERIRRERSDPAAT